MCSTIEADSVNSPEPRGMRLEDGETCWPDVYYDMIIDHTQVATSVPLSDTGFTSDSSFKSYPCPLPDCYKKFKRASARRYTAITEAQSMDLTISIVNIKSLTFVNCEHLDVQNASNASCMTRI